MIRFLKIKDVAFLFGDEIEKYDRVKLRLGIPLGIKRLIIFDLPISEEILEELKDENPDIDFLVRSLDDYEKLGDEKSYLELEKDALDPHQGVYKEKHAGAFYATVRFFVRDIRFVRMLPTRFIKDPLLDLLFENLEPALRYDLQAMNFISLFAYTVQAIQQPDKQTEKDMILSSFYSRLIPGLRKKRPNLLNKIRSVLNFVRSFSQPKNLN